MIAVCLATRGRLALLGETIARMIETSVLPDTRIIVGFDRDEADSINVEGLPPHLAHKLVISIEDREDSLGEKYNRIAAQVDADLYVLATDDCTIITQGWDKGLADIVSGIPDRIAILAFGSMTGAGFESGNPAMLAMTAEMKRMNGEFCTPHFPTWWHDTWMYEVGVMCGRLIQVNGIEVAYPDVNEARKSRGIRDAHYWAKFFQHTRSLRQDAARSIINSDLFVESNKRKRALLKVIPRLTALFDDRDRNLLDPNKAQEIESVVSFDAPADERYLRLKAKAQSTQPALRVVA